MPLSSLIAIANFKAILDFIKDFSNLPAFMRLVAIFVISETLFLKEFCFEKTGIAKKKGQQEQESDFNIE
jgi:hypothetical protein